MFQDGEKLIYIMNVTWHLWHESVPREKVAGYPPRDSKNYIGNGGGDFLKKEIDKKKISKKVVREDKREPRETEWFIVECCGSWYRERWLRTCDLETGNPGFEIGHR